MSADPALIDKLDGQITECGREPATNPLSCRRHEPGRMTAPLAMRHRKRNLPSSPIIPKRTR